MRRSGFRPAARLLRAVAALFVLAVPLAGCAGTAPRAGALDGWNVVLVTIDTMRADHAGFAGCREADTPVMDRLASHGRY